MKIKITVFFIVLALIFTCSAQDWKMFRASELKYSGKEISKTDFDDNDWLDAVVPGTVLTSLVKNNILPDPYYGTNNRLEEGLIPDISQVGRDYYTFWFRTVRTAPVISKGQRFWLHPLGINYRAEVWVNGNLLSSIKGMFIDDYIDLTPYVKSGEKFAIAILVYPVDMPGERWQKPWGAIGEFHNGGNGEIGYNVTQLMTAGWDFTYDDGIRDRNTGIWKAVDMYVTGQIDMRFPFVKSSLSHPDYNNADLTVSVEVFNPSNSNDGVTCNVKGEIFFADSTGNNESICTFDKDISLMRCMHKTVSFTAGEFPQLNIKNPNLWWPKNKGKQNLYTLKLICTVNGQISDSLQTRFGIREVMTTRNTPDSSKMFVINGKPIFIHGSNWLPEAMLRTDDRRMETEMRYTAQSGINLLRLWGGGIAESDRFYELCDEYGILVWQEFWMTGDTRHPHDEPIYLANVENTVKRLRNHPSLAFYVASNESTEVTGTKELLNTIDGTRPYQMQSETDGVHDGSPYKQVNPMQHYENTASDRGSRIDGFNPEYGAPSLPLPESLKEMMPDSLLWPIDKSAWDYLDGGGFHLMTGLYNDMVNQYGESSDIEEYSRKAQLVNAVNSKSIWETWNYNRFNSGDRFCSGLLFWYHNSANPQVCARMWDYYLEPTASLYHTMHSLEPLHVQFDYLKNTVSVTNDLPQSFDDYTVNAYVYTLDSKKLYEKTVKTDIPSEATACDVIDLTEKIKEFIQKEDIIFIYLTLSDKHGKEISNNFYWYSSDKYQGANTLSGPATAGFQSLQNMPEAKLKINKTLKTSDGKTYISLTVKNTSDKIAFFNRIQVLDGNKKPLHGTYYSDNFFTLMPHGSKTIEIEADCLHPAVSVEGWNSKKQLIQF